MKSRTAFACISVLAAALACSESTSPRGPSVHDVAINQFVTGKLAAGDSSLYRFRSTGFLALSAQILVGQGGVSLSVTDSTGAALLPPVAGLSADTAWKATAYTHLVAGGTFMLHVVAGTAGAEYQVRLIGTTLAPEKHASVLVANDTVGDEFLDDPNDLDLFTFAPQPGHEYVVYAQGSMQDTSVIIGLDITASDGMGGVTRLTLTPADFELNRLYLRPAPVTYTFLVRGLRSTGVPSMGPLPYRFVVREINHAPEKASALLLTSDTVSEAIDYAGDVDEFKFFADSGDQVNLSFRSLIQPTAAFTVDLLRGAESTALLYVEHSDTFHVTGRFTVAAQDTFRLRIAAVDGLAGLPRGPYRFQLYRVNPAPEDVSQTTFALGGGVTGESIEAPGDVDEFSMTVPADTFAAVYIWETGVSPGSYDASKALELQVVNPADGKLLGAATAPFGGSDSVGTSVMRLSAGTYRVRVFGARSQPAAFTGAYGIASGAFDTLPETRPALFAIGDTVSERIAPPGDEDHYRFRGARGQPVNLCLQATGSPDEGAFAAVAESPVPWGLLGIVVGAPAPSGSLCTYQSHRFTLPFDTLYSVTVSSDTKGTLPQTHSPYRLAVLPYPVTPETASADIKPGDSVTTERMDEPGDVDEFHVIAPPGTVVQTWFKNNASGMLQLQALYPGTVDTLKTFATWYPVTVFGRVTVPASGQVNLRFFEQRLYGAYGNADNGVSVVGPYSFWTKAVNRAPESVPAAIAIGDTIQGEKLDYEGDIDEFAFADTAGDTVQVYLQFPNGYIGIPGVRLDVVAPDGIVLGSVSGWNPTTNLEDMTTGRFRLPVAGTYTVRVQPVNDMQEASVGAYRFRVAH